MIIKEILYSSQNFMILPILKVQNVIVKMVRFNKTLIIISDTGSGKSTQLPRLLYDAGLTQSGSIFSTQPRRIATVTVAQRVIAETGLLLGREVGYSLRFEDLTCPSTQIKYLTDGFLLREAIFNPLLSKYCIAIMDEAHERVLQTEIIISILKRILFLRPDSLRVIIMSATLDVTKFSKYFEGAPCSRIRGRQFPVKILYKHSEENKFDLFRETINTVIQIHLEEPQGDILVFLPGQEDIETLESHLKKRIEHPNSSKFECTEGRKNITKTSVSGLVIVTIYSNLPPDLQLRAFNPPPDGYRKVILATNIAETSITINGVRYVVDPGLVKRRIYNAQLDCDSIMIVSTSQAQSRQRAGRAGRQTHGSCFRLYSEKSFLRLKRISPIDISKEHLMSMILQLKLMGIVDIINFDFLDPPPINAMYKSLEALLKLGAIDFHGNITKKIGLKMCYLPLEPMLAKTILISEILQCSKEALLIVSAVSTKESVFYFKNRKIKSRKEIYHTHDGDHLMILNLCHAFMKVAPDEQSDFCNNHSLNPRFFQKTHEIHRQLAKYLKWLRIPLVSCGNNINAIKKALTIGFFPQIALRRPSGQYMVMASGLLVELYPSLNRTISANNLSSAESVIFGEQLLTSRHYIKDITVIKKKMDFRNSNTQKNINCFINNKIKSAREQVTYTGRILCA
eukprot:gnl/TRDRNA2_/TRDRNA2_177756_c0_seq1.p1 gnl/TRDRNA2_/TRDRNA2_177756_c0~~gnl/TRDRNA2_/TRDRNA2_177756_c0_seq1.p1  ORF type:complete len:682 (-),score=-52.12 gnl/TRDRNA2_/TRDRNA2_177756_c0_seq1:17-2062(-)